MKKGDVIQLTVIILAFIIGFTAIQYFFYSVVNLVYLAGAGEFASAVSAPTIVILIVTVLECMLCWLLLVRSAKIADFIYEKTSMGTSFKIISQPNDLLYILLIITGFYFLLENLPVLIRGLVNAFRSKATSRFDVPEYNSHIDWTTTIIKLLLPAVLLMAARPIANYFAKNVREEPVVIGDDADNIGENEIIND